MSPYSVSEQDRVIVFVSEGWDQLDRTASMRDNDYTLIGRGNSNFRSKIVLEELLDSLRDLPEAPYVVLRLHPKDLLSNYGDLVGEVDQISEGGNPLEVVFAADLVVGMTSMLLLEAAIVGVSTLAIVPKIEERAWLPSIANGVTACVGERKALRAYLASDWSLIGNVEAVTEFIHGNSAELFCDILMKERMNHHV